MRNQSPSNTCVVMLRKKNISTVLYDILNQFSICPQLSERREETFIVVASGKQLICVTKNTIESGITSLTDSIFMKGRSNLSDTFVSMDDIGTFVQLLRSHIKRLDHIGFCYTVSSQEDERKRILREVSKTNWHMYEMESVDLEKWYFIGNKNNWQDPMIELLPVVLPTTLSKDIAYWMPHIQIDINTDMSAEEIVRMSKDVFGDTRKPILYTDHKWGTGTHCVRIWLGVVSGVNIQLDLSTNVRNLEWVRKNMLVEIKV